MSKEIITRLEKESGFVAPDEKLLPDISDKEKFIDYALKNGFIGVNYDDRVKFLEANDYKITRANLIDRELSNRITPNADPGEEIVKQLQAMDTEAKSRSSSK